MSLKKQTFSGVFWTFVDTFLVRGLTFLAMVLLARWLGPKDFGLVGMIAVFIAIGTTLTDSGLTNSLIRTKDPDQGDYSTVFYVNIVMSCSVYTIIYFSAPGIAHFFDQKVLIDIIRVYSLLFIVLAFSAVQLAIFTRDMEFKTITKVNTPSTIIGVSIGLYLGYNGYGVWSIVWMYLSTQLVKAALLWLFSSWKPKLLFSKEKFIYHYNFGYKLLLSALIDTIFKNSYNILIGKYFSAQTLGFYERAKQFGEYPSSTLTNVLSKVSYPMLSKIQDDSKRLETSYKKLIRVSFFVIAPLMLGTAAVAKPLFLLVLGQEWLPAVVFFQILSLAMMLYPIHAFNLNILKVYGRSDLFLKLEIIKKSIITVSIIVAFQFGVLGLVWSSVFTSFASLGINMFYSSRLINYPVFVQLKDLGQIFITTILTALAMYSLTVLLPKEQLELQVVLASIFGALLYICINYVNKKSPLHEAVSLYKTRNQ
ncbi:Membrane protein involved in the export of O-antigen and teichoic acid [Lishizhenia tianjinensis]|uniref:Membrane protein involved in the export of O-antigen and teichoic acid n=1 Tax=Lishizhenia tianjinensis TaxID=477690 RepID=A0A1I6ZJR6_9FLAO|nr:lipopolysaccharide biosynthesis protein [Lishizhenia tianjinensis]SFT62835.1 Membrane protein involved in the export of O-antigen and teichoic acid [Lishizhenia tianjinensis]